MEEGKGDNPIPIAKRSNRPGTKNKDMFKWEELPYEQMEGPLAVEEYLQQLIRKDPADIDKIIALPTNVNKNVWMYEHLRQFLLELNLFILYHNDVCTVDTYPKMKITVGVAEYVFLCSAFNPPKECSALDYMINTVAQATSMLNSKLFPSRVMIKDAAAKNFAAIARRLYRIFAFSYFCHRDLFDKYENQTHLCERFTKFCLNYKLFNEKIIGDIMIPASHWEK